MPRFSALAVGVCLGFCSCANAGGVLTPEPPGRNSSLDDSVIDRAAWQLAQPVIINTNDLRMGPKPDSNQVTTVPGFAPLQTDGPAMAAESEDDTAANAGGGAGDPLVPNSHDYEPPRSPVLPGVSFDGISQTRWYPPDPGIAVGPEHIVQVVNKSVAFFLKDGTKTFEVQMNSDGDPGFFEAAGAGELVYDPRCVYDHHAERFVIVALETDLDQGAWMILAVSDDDDPHGEWYVYRTSVREEGEPAPGWPPPGWWDDPSVGYDKNHIYISAERPGDRLVPTGLRYRTFHKHSLLTGGAAMFSTLRNDRYSWYGPTRSAVHFGENPAAYFVQPDFNVYVDIDAIITNPQETTLYSTRIERPFATFAHRIDTAGGNAIDALGKYFSRGFWRQGVLYTGGTNRSGRTQAALYEIQTHGWPQSGMPPRFVHGNNVAKHDDKDALWFPTAAVNARGDIGVVMGHSSDNHRPSIALAGQAVEDERGIVGVPTLVRTSTVDVGGRFGDYFGIAVDPADDTTFWYVGQYNTVEGWQTRIGSFRIEPLADRTRPGAFDDEYDAIWGGYSADLDVTANDVHDGGELFNITTFDTLTANGGTVERLPGAGTAGRDALRYTAPRSFAGFDSFVYTIMDERGNDSAAMVRIEVQDSDLLRPSDHTVFPLPGLDVAFYETPTDLTALPDFSTLLPYLRTTVPNIYYPNTWGSFDPTGRDEHFGGVYEGYFRAQATGRYGFSLESDDGSKLFIGDDLVVDNDGVHTPRVRSGWIHLERGLHRLRVEHWEKTGRATLIVRALGPGLFFGVLSPAVLFRENPCPGDATGDGVVAADDLHRFLGLFRDGDAAADIDGDGTLSARDVVAYVRLFRRGCES